MIIGYVLVNTEPGHVENVLAAMKKIDAVKEADMVYGVFDIIVKVEADTMDKLREIVTWQVRRVDKIRSTQTLIEMK